MSRSASSTRSRGSCPWPMQDPIPTARRHARRSCFPRSYADAALALRSQFFCTVAPTSHLDGRHCVFGEVLEVRRLALPVAAHPPCVAFRLSRLRAASGLRRGEEDRGGGRNQRHAVQGGGHRRLRRARGVSGRARSPRHINNAVLTRGLRYAFNSPCPRQRWWVQQASSEGRTPPAPRQWPSARLHAAHALLPASAQAESAPEHQCASQCESVRVNATSLTQGRQHSKRLGFSPHLHLRDGELVV